jgi:hypothetical protein
MESYLALKDVCRVDEAMAAKIVTSTIDAILDRLLPSTDRKVASPQRHVPKDS